MKNPATILGLVFLSTIGPLSRSETVSDRISLDMPEAELTFVLELCQRVTKKRIWIELGTYPKVSIVTKEPVTTVQAMELIRKTLLEKYGIELRDGRTDELFVSWSQEPKYRHLRESPASPPAHLPSRNRVRVPATTPK
jgi:hypothetical protein